MSEEIWRQCVDETGRPIGKYEVSNKGRLRNGEKILVQQTKTGSEYKRVHLYVSGRGAVYFSVHRLVALAFPEICGNWFEGATVDHLNGIKDDNRPENLFFKTIADNVLNPVTAQKTAESSKRNLENMKPSARLKMALSKSKPVVADGLTQVFMNVYALAEYLGVTPHAVYEGIHRPCKVRGFTVRYAGDC